MAKPVPGGGAKKGNASFKVAFKNGQVKQLLLAWGRKFKKDPRFEGKKKKKIVLHIEEGDDKPETPKTKKLFLETGVRRAVLRFALQNCNFKFFMLLAVCSCAPARISDPIRARGLHFVLPDGAPAPDNSGGAVLLGRQKLDGDKSTHDESEDPQLDYMPIGPELTYLLMLWRKGIDLHRERTGHEDSFSKSYMPNANSTSFLWPATPANYFDHQRRLRGKLKNHVAKAKSQGRGKGIRAAQEGSGANLTGVAQTKRAAKLLRFFGEDFPEALEEVEVLPLPANLALGKASEKEGRTGQLLTLHAMGRRTCNRILGGRGEDEFARCAMMHHTLKPAAAADCSSTNSTYIDTEADVGLPKMREAARKPEEGLGIKEIADQLGSKLEDLRANS